MEQSLMEKLTILADSAKYDVACTSSGASRAAKAGSMGSCYAPGCCHAFTADGRCVSLLKVLMTNCCAFDGSYCVNRRSNDAPRATFSPRELAELTIEFYRRNYIEGLFLSSAVLVSPDYTTERMLKTLRLLRNEYHFGGYIHAKAIPGTSPELLEQLGFLADRLSVNVELPSESSLKLLAPDKGRHSIFRPMKQIAVEGAANREELTLYRKAPRFAPAGQSTQMIVGASPETDHHILKLTEGMYQKYSLKRVFYSAYIPVAEDTRLPALDTKPPLLREHRLYQADWLLRFYQFKADEILDADHPNFNPYLDPKCNWAVHQTVRTRTRFFTRKGSGTFFVYRKFCGRTTQSVKRAKAGYHYDSGILPFALWNQVRFVRTWSSPYMARLGVVAAYVHTGSLYTSDKV